MQFIVKVFESERLDKIYYFLCILRILLTLIPQNGYIHPDEFFQTMEVMGGDIFDIETNRPWEYNVTFPVRSIFTTYVTVGIPYKILRIFDFNLRYYCNITIRTPYWILVTPRLFYCLLSFIVDYSLYKICKINYEKHKEKLVILASSYVMLVYGTHTFSNSIEMILMSILMYLVIDSHKYSYAVVKQDQFLQKKYDECNTGIDRARLYKVQMALPSHSLRHCLLISFIVTTGVFNRATFIAFAFPCLFFWIYRGIGYKIITFSEVHLRMLLFISYSVMFASLFVIIDSIYFGYLSGIEIMEMDVSLKNFLVTPINLIKYNINVNNLALHGLHPRFLHLLVNVPLLFNVLGLVVIAGALMSIYKIVFKKFRHLPSIYNIRTLMASVVFMPIAILSYFPHQEPRFLIPLILPMVYLSGDIVSRSNSLKRMWWLINIICVIFYGFIHQAGLFPATRYLSKQLQNNQQIHLVTSHVYNLPEVLFVQRNSRRLYDSGRSKYLLPKTLILHELGSKPSNVIVKHLQVIHNMKSNPQSMLKKNSLIFLLAPLSKEYELNYNFENTTMKIAKIHTFYPHISTEALPNSIFTFTNFFEMPFLFLYNFVKSCGLGLYQVHYKF